MKSKKEENIKILAQRDKTSKAIHDGIVDYSCSEDDPIQPLLNDIKEPKPRKNKFKMVDKRSLLTVECPSCKEVFGVSIDFTEKVSEILYQYACPYCKYEGRMEDI